MENLEGPKSGWSPVWGAKRLYTWTYLTVLFSFLTSPSVSGFFIKYKQQFPRASPSVQLSEVRNRGSFLGDGRRPVVTCDWEQTLCTVLTQPCGQIFSTRQALMGGCKSPHVISPALQWDRALMLQARFTRQPAECGRWKAGAHLPSHTYTPNMNSGAVIVNKCNLLLWTRHPGRCLLLSLGMMFCTAVLWLCQIGCFSLTGFL